MINVLARKLPLIALVLALLLPVWFLVASLGAKFGLWSKMTGFATMTAGIGPILAAIVAVIALVALVLALLVKPRRGWIASLIALAIPLAIFAGFNALRSQAASVPFIYDVTTDTADPPTYSAALMKQREAEKGNAMIDFDRPLREQEKWAESTDVGTKTAAQMIASDYPDLKPLTTDRGTSDVLGAIEAAMKMRGYDNIAVDREAGTVEGTEELFWYGFRDDIVARVRDSEGGSKVDFRSTSRLGTSDLGVNAGRIMDLRAAVADRLERDFEASAEIEPDAEPIMEEAPEGSD